MATVCCAVAAAVGVSPDASESGAPGSGSRAASCSLGVAPIWKATIQEMQPNSVLGQRGTSRTPLPLLSAVNHSGFSVSIYVPVLFMSDPGESRR